MVSAVEDSVTRGGSIQLHDAPITSPGIPVSQAEPRLGFLIVKVLVRIFTEEQEVAWRGRTMQVRTEIPMPPFFTRSLISAGAFTLSAAMVWLVLGLMPPDDHAAPASGFPNPTDGVAAIPAPPASPMEESTPIPDRAPMPNINSPSPSQPLTPGEIAAAMNDVMASVVERSLPGVVKIMVERVRTMKQTRLVGSSGPQEEQRTIRDPSVGSGAIVSSSGYLLTNLHVVSGGTGEEVDIRVVLHGDDEPRSASLVDQDETLDLAVLHIEPKTPGEVFPYLTFGDSDVMRVGYSVLAIGSPLNLAETVTFGFISYRSRRVADTLPSFLQIDCAINPGNSGGPLLNVSGELIGINTRLVTGPVEAAAGQAYGQSYGLAIPSNDVQDSYDRMIHKGRPRGYLGVSVADWPRESYQQGKQPDSAVVLGVERASPAAEAGLKKDDVVKSLDGLPVRSAAEFFRRLRKKQVGEKLVLGVERDGAFQSLTTEVANLNTIFAAQPEPANAKVAGLGVRDLRGSEQLRYHLRETFGVLVRSVDADSPLRDSIEPGDLILGLAGKGNLKITGTEVFVSGMADLLRTGGTIHILRNGEMKAVSLNRTIEP